MDVTTMRFIIIFFIILIGLLIIPVGVLIYWVRKYEDKGKWWMPVIMIIYLISFISYSDLLIPERWTLKPVEVYHCEWKTNYIPKYPIND